VPRSPFVPPTRCVMPTLRRLVPVIVVPIVLGCQTGNNGAKAPAPAPSAPAAPREQAENPQYASWAGFKPGTSIVHKSVTATAGVEAVTTTMKTFTLIDLTDTRAVVEMRVKTKRYDGVEMDNPPEKFTFPRRITLPPGVSQADFGKPSDAREHGEEIVTLGGKDYPTRWSKGKDRNEAGEVFVQVWSSDAVPGGLVKSVTRIPAVGKTTTIELLDVKVP
jgi:hypothetical protein